MRQLPAIVCFSICALMLLPHSFWLYGMERALFSRLYVLPLTLILIAFTQYFAVVAADWPVSKRYFKVSLPVLVLLIVIVPLVAAVAVATVPLWQWVFARTGSLLRLDRIPVACVGLPAQLAAAALLVLVLFPAMNYQSVLIGPIRQFVPPILAAHPLFEINAEGYRGPLVAKQLDPSRTRLLFLGDSVTFGFPYPRQHTFPSLVKERLEQQGLGEFEVLNAGILGQSVAQIADQANHHLAYEPDVVLLMVGFHHRNIQRDIAAIAETEPDYADHSLKLHFHPPILLPLVALSLQLITPLEWKWQGEREREPKPHEELVLYRNTLGELIGDLAAAGRRVVVLEHPSPKIPQTVQDATRKITARHRQTFVPLAQLFSSKEDFANSDDVHPNLAGHERIATSVVDALVPLLRHPQ